MKLSIPLVTERLTEILDGAYRKLTRRTKKISSYCHNQLPYVSQWESRQLIGSIIRHEIRAESDPLWRKSGASDVHEYALWSKNLCGMACLKMILRHQSIQEYPLVELGKQCLAFGGYVHRNDEIAGLYYRPFLTYIKEKYNLTGTVYSHMSLDDILVELTEHKYCMVSVSPEIRKAKPNYAGKTGGHLVLIAGSDIENRTLYIHNPSGDTVKSQEYAPVSFDTFEKYFAHRGIVVDNLHTFLK